MLATGGGSNDRSVKLWNVLNGTCQRTVDAESPVSIVLTASHDN